MPAPRGAHLMFEMPEMKPYAEQQALLTILHQHARSIASQVCCPMMPSCMPSCGFMLMPSGDAMCLYFLEMKGPDAHYCRGL